jgi:periplasmic protein CpxP/Spy
MKRMSLLLVAVVAFAAAYAQPGGGFQRRTVEERVAIIHAKMDSAFKLEATKLAEVDAIFTTYYKESDKAREEMMAGGERPSREVMQAKMQPLTEARDEKLKKALPEAQYEIWKKQIEPGMRPQRQGGGGGGGNN